jgi:dipeptidyl aminopeptidase/acylaminoacyl peptidase
MHRRLVSDLVAGALAACVATAVGGCTADPPAPVNVPSNSSVGEADRIASSSADLPLEQAVFVDVRTGKARELPAGLTPRWSSDGSSIVFVRGGFASSRLAIMDVETGDVRILQGIAGMVSDPTFAPDNRSILFTMAVPGPRGSWRASLWTVPANDGTPTPLIPYGAYGSYSPDGSRIAYHRTFRGADGGVSSRLSFVDADRVIDDPDPRTGSRTFGVPPRAFSAAGVRWSPDGTKVLETGVPASTYGPSEIAVRDLRSRAISRLGDGIWPTWFDDHTLIVTEFGRSGAGMSRRPRADRGWMRWRAEAWSGRQVRSGPIRRRFRCAYR